jgi:hypothetical protein
MKEGFTVFYIKIKFKPLVNSTVWFVHVRTMKGNKGQEKTPSLQEMCSIPELTLWATAERMDSSVKW